MANPFAKEKRDTLEYIKAVINDEPDITIDKLSARIQFKYGLSKSKTAEYIEIVCNLLNIKQEDGIFVK